MYQMSSSISTTLSAAVLDALVYVVECTILRSSAKDKASVWQVNLRGCLCDFMDRQGCVTTQPAQA